MVFGLRFSGFYVITSHHITDDLRSGADFCLTKKMVCGLRFSGFYVITSHHITDDLRSGADFCLTKKMVCGLRFSGFYVITSHHITDDLRSGPDFGLAQTGESLPTAWRRPKSPVLRPGAGRRVLSDRTIIQHRDRSSCCVTTDCLITTVSNPVKHQTS